MDQTTLVRSDLEIEGRVLQALSRARIPVTLCDWDYLAQLAEWQLVIATPWYESKGPREAISRILRALQDAGIYKDVPLRRLFIKSPEDPLVKTLKQEIRNRKEGAIHILGRPRTNHNRQYSVVFAPFSGGGGPVPAKHVSGKDELRQFLEKRLRIAHGAVDDALADLARKGSASIFNVQLTARQAKSLGLA